MKELLFDYLICILTAMFLMMLHELSKSAVYMLLQKRAGRERKYTHSIFAVHRYIDPVGVILSVTSSVAFSKPFMFRIQNKKYNRILGFTGFFVLLFCFVLSVCLLKMHVFGIRGLETLTTAGIPGMVVSLFLQYLAILSAGMFLTNLFPVSTFDMGLLIASASAGKYLGLIKMDSVIKLIYVFTLFIGLIRYGVYRLLMLIL